jgi:hypothetical protein
VSAYVQLCWGNPPVNPVCDTAFADFLYKQERFNDAGIEYDRLIFTNSDSLLHDRWQYKKALCLLQSGKIAEALPVFLSVSGGSIYSDSSKILGVNCLLTLRKFEKADSIASFLPSDYGLYVKGYVRLMTGDFPSSVNFFSGIGDQSPMTPRVRSLALMGDSLANFHPKNIALAGTLSVLPGLGHVYTERYGDALFNLSVIGIFAGIGAYYYHYEAYGRAAAFESIAGLFYLGNIYGAMVSVRLYNSGKTNGFIKKAERIFSAP